MSTHSTTPTPSKRKCPNFDPNTKEPLRPGGSCPEYNTPKGCPRAHPWQDDWYAEDNNNNSGSHFNIATKADISGVAFESLSTLHSHSSWPSSTHLDTPDRSKDSNSNLNSNNVDGMVIDLDSDEIQPNLTGNIPSKSSGSSIQLISGPEPVSPIAIRTQNGAATGRTQINGSSSITRTSRASRATHTSRPSNSSRTSQTYHQSAVSKASVPDSSVATFVTARSAGSTLSKTSIISPVHPTGNTFLSARADLGAVVIRTAGAIPQIDAMDTSGTSDRINEVGLAEKWPVTVIENEEDPSLPLEIVQERQAVEIFLKHLIRTLHYTNRMEEAHTSLTSFKDLWKAYDTRLFDAIKLQLKDVLGSETKGSWINGKTSLIQQVEYEASSSREWIRGLIEIDGTMTQELVDSGNGEPEAADSVRPQHNIDTGGDSPMKDVGASGGTTPRPTDSGALVIASGMSQQQQNTEAQEETRQMTEPLRRWRERLKRGAIGDRLGALRLELERVMRANRIPLPGHSSPPPPPSPQLLVSKVSTTTEPINQTTRESAVTSVSGPSSAEDMASISVPDERDEVDELEEDIDVEMSDLPGLLSSYERSLLRKLHAKVTTISDGLDAAEEWATEQGWENNVQLWEKVDDILRAYIAEKTAEKSREMLTEPNQLAVVQASGEHQVVPKASGKEPLRKLVGEMVDNQRDFQETMGSAEYILRLSGNPVGADFNNAKTYLMKVRNGPEITRLRTEEARLSQMLQEIETRKAQTPATPLSSTPGMEPEMVNILKSTVTAQAAWIKQSPALQQFADGSPVDAKSFHVLSEAISSAPDVCHKEWSRTFEQLKRETLDLIQPTVLRTEEQKERLKRDKEQHLGQTQGQDRQNHYHGQGYGNGVGHNAVGSHS